MEMSSLNLPRRSALAILLTLLVLLFGSMARLAYAQASVVQVNVFDDSNKNNDGTCSLREAIIAANKDKPSGGKQGECKNVSGADTILLPPGVYTLSRTDNGNEDSSATGDLDIVSDITIKPSGPGLVVISGNGITDRIFHIISGNVTIEGVTIRDGRASSVGGGIYNQGGTLTLRNSTLTGNAAGSAGGGLYNSGTTMLTNVTVTGNSAPTGSGLSGAAGSLTVRNSIIAADTCQGSYTGSNNLAYNAAGCSAGATGNPQLQAVTVPALSPRAAYFALPLTSPAVNAFSDATCPATDQLGLARPSGSACDLGAIELKIVNVAPTANDDTLTTVEDTAATLNVAANDSDPEGALNLGSVTIVSAPASGTAVVTASPTVQYTPNANFNGSDSFTYQICDSAGLCDTAVVTVTVNSDGFIEVTNANDSGPGSLRWAIELANAAPAGYDKIIFQIGGADSCTAATIFVASELPAISDPALIDGTLQQDGDRCPAAHITLTPDPNAATEFSGLTILASGAGTTIRDLIITGFAGSGVVIGPDGPSDGNQLLGNTISNNGSGSVTIPGPGGTTIPLNDGVTIISGVNNNLTGNPSPPDGTGPFPNNITGNADLGVDLGGDGNTANDFGDGDIGANFVQNYPSLFRAGPNPNAGADSGKLIIEGFLNSRPNTAYTLQFYASESCLSGDLSLLALKNPAEAIVVTDKTPGVDAGDAFFSLLMAQSVPQGWAIRATATDASGNTSEFSPCIRVGAGNDTWPAALRLTAGGQTGIQQYLDLPGQSRWYKIKVDPTGKVSVTLKNLPKNYDVVVFKDIAQAYSDLIAPQDLNRLSAEFASDAIAPSALSPSALSPSALSPSALSPSALSPDNFAPSALSPSALSPSALSPSALSPDAISPSALSPSAFSPSAFSPSAFSPSALSPSALSADVYASAQSRSLIGVSAFDDVATETITVNTWNNSGDFYIRVRGREGAFDPNNTFTIDVTTVSQVCNAYSAALAGNPLPATSLTAQGSPDSLFLVDWGRLTSVYGASEVANLQAKLDQLKNRPEVNGVVIDVAQDARVSAANSLGDAYPECPAAKNLVAEAIKDVIDLYGGGTQYVVLLGGDNVIPFYRYPDNALLGPESDYVPPVLDSSASQASLRNNYVLGQDGYGAPFGISFKDSAIPFPKVPVGRLVESPAEMGTVIDAYLATTNGVAPTPASTFVGGYDFMYDAALAVKSELEAGTGQSAEFLLTDPSKSPLDPASWTAEQLAAKLSQQRYDVMFLAGHFSANSALAADYATSLITTDLLAVTSGIDMRNTLVFSNGCHSGYNIPLTDSIPGITFNPDWPQAFAQKGATLIAGTGYQYGDTDFIEYSERIYLNFSKELRTGTGPVAIGDAFVAAKQGYLADTPVLRGIHEKALLEATIFGLPFLKINMPGARLTDQNEASVVTGTTPVGSGPGAQLSLSYADFSVSPQFTPPNDSRERPLELLNIDDDTSVVATYWTGSDGIVSNPGEPVLPLESANVGVAGKVLRGVGFRSADYEDLANSQPLVGAPTTELRAVHLAFLSNVFFPLRPWSVNYFDALSETNGETVLNVFPAQYLANTPEPATATLRLFDELNYRLYYSGYTASAGANEPALAAEPTIVSVKATFDDVANEVNFELQVVGNPGAGIQSVWVTYTGQTGDLHGSWQSLDLTQSANDSSIWTGTLSLAGSSTPAADLRFIAQAVSGVGLVSRADNIGRYYVPGGDIERQATQITLLPGANSGKVGQTAVFEAVLYDDDNPATDGRLANRLVAFGLGQETRIVRTDAQGKARTEIPLLARPDVYTLTAWFLGDVDYAPSTADSRPFTIQQQQTKITLVPQEAAYSSPDAPVEMLALLQDVEGRRLPEKSVLFEISGGAQPIYKAVITDLLGQARLGKITLDGTATSYTVKVTFAGTDSYAPSATPPGSLGTITVNRPPVCDNVIALTTSGKDTIWPANNKMVGVVLSGATDPDGDALTYRFVSIFQDEPVGGDLDGSIANSCTTAEVRGQRDGNGDGRVYHLNFIVEDGRGGTCSGETTIATIPHDQGSVSAIDQGPLFNSLGDNAPACTP